tara:strand:+ start:286 stop:564 length:279 start_codon:yes stop_codon:yes gene_type:complete
MTNIEFHSELFEDIDLGEFVSFVANELDEGAMQALFSESELDQGKHYEEAKQVIDYGDYAFLVHALNSFKTQHAGKSMSHADFSTLSDMGAI